MDGEWEAKMEARIVELFGAPWPDAVEHRDMVSVARELLKAGAVPYVDGDDVDDEILSLLVDIFSFDEPTLEQLKREFPEQE